jgi:hypothetical protein
MIQSKSPVVKVNHLDLLKQIQPQNRAKKDFPK